MKRTIKRSKKRKVEIVVIRKKLEKRNNQSGLETNSKIFDGIINSERSSSNMTWFGYVHNNSKEFSSSTTLKSDKGPKSYADTLKNSFKKEENYKMTNINQHKFSFLPKINEYRRNSITRRTPRMRYPYLFLGYCLSCNNFGHKAGNAKPMEREIIKEIEVLKELKIMII